MSLQANIEHLEIASGIEAVLVDADTRNYRGAQQWRAVLDGALDLFKRTEEKSIRLVVGKHTIVVQKEGEETVAVVLPTGHAIAKSLRRMIRRMARKDRGPLPKPKPAEEVTPVHEAATPVHQQGAPSVGIPSVAQSTPPSSGQPTVASVTKSDETKTAPMQSPVSERSHRII